MEYDQLQDLELHLGRRERLRLRIRLGGLDVLKDHEIIEYLLYYAVPRLDMNDQAHALIDRFGCVGNVLHAELRELIDCGLTPSAARWICMLGDAMADIGSMRRAHNIYLPDLFAALVYGFRLYRRLPSPSTVQLCLDKYSRLLYQREITPSRSWGEPIVLRDALHDMISTNARYALILQFTGSDIAEPDDYDFQSAEGYSAALNLAGCRLNDVVLIGDSGSASLRQLDRLPARTNDARTAAFYRKYLHEVPDIRNFGTGKRRQAEPAPISCGAAFESDGFERRQSAKCRTANQQVCRLRAGDDESTTP